MTRSMGDAIGVNAGWLLRAGVDMVAGYVTGDGDVPWDATDWAIFAGRPVVTIDQGAHGSPVPAAIVRDVETGAWTPAAAVNRSGWTPLRPTIYCNRSTLPAILGLGWRGDLWLAYPGWQPGQPLPAAPGCNYVAIQNKFNVANAYDESVVLDDTWPHAAQPSTEAIIMEFPGIPGIWLKAEFYTDAKGTQYLVGLGTDYQMYLTKKTAGAAWAAPVLI